MPKKAWGTNEKVEEARARKSGAKAAAAAEDQRRKDDQYWQQYDNPKGRKDVRREEDARKKDEAAIRRAETRRLAAEEEASIGRSKVRPQRPAAPKVTAHQLSLAKAREQDEAQVAAREKERATRREVSEEAYQAQVDVENINVKEGGFEASGLEAALGRLDVGGKAADRHPEKYVERAFGSWLRGRSTRKDSRLIF